MHWFRYVALARQSEGGFIVSLFEFVFGLYSIIVSLALTHLLAGMISLRDASRVRFSLTHALWAWAAFAMAIGNWASMWELREMQSWPSWSVLLLISTAIVQYVFCAFVTPEVRKGEGIDLVGFHDGQRRRYVGTALVFSAFSSAFNLAFGGANLYSDWLRDLILTIPAVAAAVLAFLVGARWVQLPAAIVFAVMATYFLLVTSNIGAGE